MTPGECESALESLGFEPVPCSHRLDSQLYPTVLFVRRRADGEFDQITLTFYPPSFPHLRDWGKTEYMKRELIERIGEKNRRAMQTVEDVDGFVTAMEMCC
jgi:hypothetical protein